MNKIGLFLSGFFLIATACASSGDEYMKKFQAYQQWSQNLPTYPDQEFIAFIESNTPLAQKLREKWLYQLARDKNWGAYALYYRPSKDVSLQCYSLIALYQANKIQEVLHAVQPVWLTGDSQPPACDALFTLLLKDNLLAENLITQRIILALENRNVSLARYLIKQYKSVNPQTLQLLDEVQRNPANIKRLEAGKLHDDFYLYGLKRLVSSNMDLAISYWHEEKTQRLLSEQKKQSFLTHIAIYKAMRNHEDAPQWFAMIKPQYYSDALLDWQIRFALKQQKWQEVERLIYLSPNKTNPAWQYWLARSLEAQGEQEYAHPIYNEVAKTRNYYGFLASLRLRKNFTFLNEPASMDTRVLVPYQPFLEQIKALYAANQTAQASRLLNDFVSELPRADKSALIYWLSNELRWHAKALYLSNNEELNNQLSLRFPLAYQHTISYHAKSYRIPPEFIYAIIRQESTFHEDVISPAGAYGLMQILPSTAKMMAKDRKIAYQDKQQLFSPQQNINIGTAYLKHLAERFKHPLLMAAAYNAGPRQVVHWLNTHPPKQIDIWIETLPWQETRNYLKNVISFYAVYQYRMNAKPNINEFFKPFN
ncbi:transglycosylase SLT domain-containing protein [Legionella septentrionalis]|uniref:transglycosylase SLT domain-containing protein n=1 Tax=Legionella septentrionalis TaxID=2498109 RepID=UPI000F8ECEBB|nr:lytic murein transglycosylase [Legionella septentrionalis]RUR15965.1 lytic murein transglycosylase [Legionella septentrionalis]